MACKMGFTGRTPNEQIAQELDLDADDAQRMSALLREGIVRRKLEVQLSGEVECDQVYVVAGHKRATPKRSGKRARGPATPAEGRTGPGARWRRRSRQSSA
jgi:hypothetical protein